MIAYSCNISCKGCISVSDISREAPPSLDDVRSWCDHWKQIIDPGVVTLFGGEPLMNKNILDICRIVRAAWPTAVIRLITNGYLLGRYDPKSWFEFGDFELQISIHRLDHEKSINHHIKNILTQRVGWKTKMIGGEQTHQQIEFSLPGFRLWKSKFQEFVTPYRLDGATIKPFRSDPAKAHAICGSPNTPVLYKGKLYKCPPVANLIDVVGENWNAYQPCTGVDTLDQFVQGVGKPESVCSQCPEQANALVYDHMAIKNVTVKKIPD